ncbi:MAG: hypothetical protein HZA22_07525 [Nitrospirae bacterium]|nr:hypothetical protein [Nitrospirota bacterium]
MGKDIGKSITRVAREYEAFVRTLPEPTGGLARELTGALAHGCPGLVEYYGALEAYPLLRAPLWLDDMYVRSRQIPARAGYGEAVARASLYGYLYIRIQDNVMDEPELFSADYLLLGNEYVREFFGIYHRLFGPDSSFWAYFRRYWLATTNNTLWERQVCGGKLRAFGDDDLTKVGGKLEGGKISMAAMCILAGRESDIARFEPVFDNLNISSQLHNDAVSFVKDLKHEYFTCVIANTLGGGESQVQPEDIFCMASIKALTGNYLEDWLGLAEDYNNRALELAGPETMPGLKEYVAAKNAHLSKLSADISEIKRDLLKI